jgi:hypothetical protein
MMKWRTALAQKTLSAMLVCPVKEKENEFLLGI